MAGSRSDRARVVYADLERWSVAAARLVADIDSPGLGRSLMEALASGVPFDGWFLAVFHKDAPPTVIDQIAAPEPDIAYAEGPYLLDPCFNRYLSEPAGGCYLLRDLAPEGFTRSRYFSTYYRYLGIGDEAAYTLPLDAQSAAHIAMSRSRGMARFSRRDLAWFKAVTPVVHQVVQRLWLRESQRSAARSREQSSLHENLSRAFELFGASVLTRRESEIVRLLLKGSSAKAVARALDISPGTARNHLKRIYPKLGVTSHAELFALFFRALEQVDAGLDSDPLLRLAAPPPLRGGEPAKP